VHEDLDVFDVVVCLVGAFELLLWFSRIHAFQNRKPSEVFERKLQLPYSLAASEILRLLSLFSLL
jgi:VanZ family protein